MDDMKATKMLRISLLVMLVRIGHSILVEHKMRCNGGILFLVLSGKDASYL